MKQTTHKSHISSLSHHRDRKELERRRKKAARFFEKGKTQSEVALKLGVTSEATRQWYDAWKKRGIKGLQSKGAPGPRPKLTPAKTQKVIKALLKGPQASGYATNMWTLKRIAAVIKKVAHVSYHQGHVWHILGSLGWSCQKPKTRAKERNEVAIRTWKRVIWPAIKKRGENYARA